MRRKMIKILLSITIWFVGLFSSFYFANVLNIKSYYSYGSSMPWYAIPYMIFISFILISSAILIGANIEKYFTTEKK